MIVKTKFDLKSYVWYMKDNKPTEVIVSAIRVFLVGTNQDSITYDARNHVDSVGSPSHTGLEEHLLFGSKAQLLESL